MLSRSGTVALTPIPGTGTAVVFIDDDDPLMLNVKTGEGMLVKDG
jgi:hypothetical protein